MVSIPLYPVTSLLQVFPQSVNEATFMSDISCIPECEGKSRQSDSALSVKANDDAILLQEEQVRFCSALYWHIGSV